MKIMLWSVGLVVIFLGFVWIACFIQAALEKMNLIPGELNSVGWHKLPPGQKEIGIMSYIPQIREYPPGYPVPPPGQPIYWYLFPNNEEGNQAPTSSNPKVIDLTGEKRGL